MTGEGALLLALALAGNGMPAAEIAARLDISENTVRVLASRLRRERSDMTVRVMPETAAMLAGEARRRGLQAASIAAAILDTVAAEDLLAAVFDDREGGR